MKKLLIVLVIAAGSSALYAQSDAGATAIIANDNKNFMTELKQYTQQITHLKETLEQAKEYVKTLKDQLKYVTALQEAVGEGKKVIEEFRSEIMNSDIVKMYDEIKSMQAELKDIYGTYDSVKGEFEGITDTIKKFESLNDLQKAAEELDKKLFSKKSKIFEDLRRLAEKAGTAETDVEVQKVQAQINTQAANLAALQQQELIVHNRLVEQHNLNINEMHKQEEVEFKDYLNTTDQQMADTPPNVDMKKAQNELYKNLW